MTMRVGTVVAVLLVPGIWLSGSAGAVTTAFFDPATQTAAVVASGTTSDTVSSEGYLFEYTLDKLFTGGGTVPIGRTQLYHWPPLPGKGIGIHAQGVTSGPNPGPATIAIRRVDGAVFDLTALDFRLLGNTSATGANLGITPILNGQEGAQVFLDASGFYGSSFSYDTSNAGLSGYDTYKMSLFVDFALTGITLVDASLPPCLGDLNHDGSVDAVDLGLFAWDFGWSGCSAQTPCAADLNQDADVDGADLWTFRQDFGRVDCPLPLQLAQ